MYYFPHYPVPSIGTIFIACVHTMYLKTINLYVPTYKCNMFPRGDTYNEINIFYTHDQLSFIIMFYLFYSSKIIIVITSVTSVWYIFTFYLKTYIVIYCFNILTNKFGRHQHEGKSGEWHHYPCALKYTTNLQVLYNIV